jgi:hypothetical protein
VLEQHLQPPTTTAPRRAQGPPTSSAPTRPQAPPAASSSNAGARATSNAGARAASNARARAAANATARAAFTSPRHVHHEGASSRTVREKKKNKRLIGYLTASRIHEKSVEELKKEGR